MGDKNWKNGFDQGYYCALSVMLREHDQPTMVEDALIGNFSSIDEMRKKGVDEIDIETLTPIIKEIERKQKL